MTVVRLVKDTEYGGPRFCTLCGKPLVLEMRETGRFHPMTGEVVVHPYGRCPDHSAPRLWEPLIPPPPKERG